MKRGSWAAALVAAWVPLTSAQFRTPEWKSFHNSTFVGAEPEEARAALFTANEHLVAGRHAEASRLLVDILRSEENGLVRFGERLVLPAKRAALLMLRRLEPQVLGNLQRQEEAAAEAAIEQWLQFGARGALEEVALRYPLGDPGERALYLLGLREVLGGRQEAGAAYFEEILRQPSTGSDKYRQLAAARLWQGMGVSGAALPDLKLSDWPTGDVTFQGSSTPLTGLDFSGSVVGWSDDWPTLGGDSSRARVPGHRVDPPTPVRCLELTPQRGVIPELADHRHRFAVHSGSAERMFPPSLPRLHGNRWLSLEADGLHVRRAETGQDLFPPLAYDFDFHLDPEVLEVDLDRSSLMVQGSMAFVTLMLRNTDVFPQESLGALFGVDLDRQAVVQFGVRGDEGEFQGWSFLGPGVVTGNDLLVLGSRLSSNDTECELFRFDTRSGEMTGRVFLARGGPVARYADRFSQDVTGRQVFPSPLSARQGVVYACTNLGVVVAIRMADLQVQWVFRYNRLLPTDSRRYTREVFYLTGGWPARAPVVFPERLLVAPADSRYLYELARWPNDAGDLILNDPVEKETRLAWIGHRDSELYFLVKRGPQQAVQATDLSGGVLWETPPLPVGDPVAGIPAQSDRFLYVPTDQRIYRLDLDREGFVDLVVPPPEAVGIPYPKAGALGDLMVTSGFLVSQSSRYLVLYEAGE